MVGVPGAGRGARTAGDRAWGPSDGGLTSGRLTPGRGAHTMPRMAKTSARQRGRVERPQEIEVPPPPPTRAARIAGVARPTWLFLALAVMSTVLAIQTASQSGIRDSFSLSAAVLRAIPT